MSVPRSKVLLAMSGGVDSSVAASLLLEAGHEVVGCFMRLGSPGEALDELIPYEQSCDSSKVRIGHQGCCSVGDAADARQVAAELGIPFYVCNFKKDFGRIINYFVDEYAAGRTPNPCVRCNDWLKFGSLHGHAERIGAEFVASGHYARVDRDGKRVHLLRGIDATKDQSYVLFGVSSERLAQTLLPVGGFHKSHIREMARELNLPVFDKPDSQEICFVPDNDYGRLVDERRPAGPGPIVDSDGNPVGEHPGHHHFTIGQRRVGVALGRPVYVVEKNARTNTVTVGDAEELRRENCTAVEANWLCEPCDGWTECLVQYRYNGSAAPGRVRVIESSDGPTHSGRSGRFEVCFDEPQRAIAPGQAIVLYDRSRPERVLGGGWIE